MKKKASIAVFLVGIAGAEIALGSEHTISGEAWMLEQQVRLSNVSEHYDDVSDGSGWSFSYLHQKNDWFRIGGGAFGLNGEAKDTDLGVYGGGMITEGVIPIGAFEFATAVQLGGASVTVTRKEAETVSKTIEEGKFTQGGGWLAAPQASLGYNFNRVRLYWFTRSVQFLAGSTEIRKFSYNNVGVGLASLF